MEKLIKKDEAVFYPNKYIVIPTKYMGQMPPLMLRAINQIMRWLRGARIRADKQPNAAYIVLKAYEPYAEEVKKMIMDHETDKNNNQES